MQSTSKSPTKALGKTPARSQDKEADRSADGRSELVFCGLGGLGEIGMNCYLYGTGPEHARQWLMVDLGITFPEGEFDPGIDVILPDIRFIEEQRQTLAGIVLTHAHEDHFGALIELWPRLQVPVYATAFTAALLRAKLAEEGNRVRIDVREIKPAARFKAGPFDLEYIAVAHSIPEPQGLLITVPEGRVLHSGDWKLDARPSAFDPPTDESRLKAIGDEGVTAFICDSTNAIRDGRSPSEADVAKGLHEVIASCAGAVAVTAFSSNVARIHAVAEAAQATGRTLVVAGRAMHRVINVALETGHLPRSLKVLDQSQFEFIPPSRSLVLCTGSQGEERAAVARIAAGGHPTITLGAGDTIIFSSRTIPGNERTVGRIQIQLIDRGVKAITEADALVHVTGHPRRDELRDMYGWVRPPIAIPMHGEARHLAAHAEIAKQMGVGQVLVARNGDIVRLAPGGARIIDEAPVGRLFRDGKLLIEASSIAVRDRRKLEEAGIVGVGLAFDRKGAIAAEPDAILDGIPERDADGTEMFDLVLDAAEGALKSIPPKQRRDLGRIEEAVRRSVRSAVEHAWGKRPVVKVMASVVG